jgi:hypothetical protein
MICNYSDTEYKLSTLEKEFERLWYIKPTSLVLFRQAPLIPGRKFRFDYYHPGSKTVIECQGGIFSRHRLGHTSGSGITNDHIKANLAVLQGLHIFYLSEKLMNRQWVEDIKNYMLSNITNP